jgi:hypothetical protein
METKPLSFGEPGGPPVLILAYNRVNELSQVLDAVVAQEPEILYVSVDGPKSGSDSDQERVSAVHETLTRFQRGHSIQTRFSEVNGGVLNGVLGGIDWFFSQETRGIILEDDVVVAPGSLALAASLLEELESHRNIGSLSLFNPVHRPLLTKPHDTIRLSTLPSSQYWGTWSDRWSATQQLRDFSPANYARVLAGIAELPDRRLRNFWRNHAEIHSKGWLCWEDLWIYTHWLHGWYAAYSNRNFSRHIGFNINATNSWDQPSWYPTSFDDTEDVLIGLDVPAYDAQADVWYFNQRFGLSPWKKVKHSVWSRMPWIRQSYLSVKGRLARKR